MAFSSFDEFGAALCDSVGLSLPPLQPDASGLVGFRVSIREVKMNIAHWASPDNDDVFILVNFGVIPPGTELESMRFMAEANFELLSATSPVFGRAPDGEVVLRQLISLRNIDKQTALQKITGLSHLARQWRDDPTMSNSRSDER